MSELPKTIPIGKVSITPQEEYNSSTQYFRLDVVSYNGGSYLAKQDAKNIVPTNTNYWLCLAEHGTPSDAQVTTAVNAWLNSNITATVEDSESIILDRSLSSNGAAAPADLAGNILETSTLYSSIMGYGRTSSPSAAGKTFDIQYNYVKIDTSGSSTVWRGVNLFGTPAAFAVASDTLGDKLGELEFYPLDLYNNNNYDFYYNLNITIQWEKLYETSTNYIYVVTKNNDTGVVLYKSLGADATTKIRSWDLFNLLPEIKENGNFTLAAVCRNSLYDNSFTYKLEYIKNTNDHVNSEYFDIMGNGLVEDSVKRFSVNKNYVKLINVTAGATAYRLCNLFGKPKIYIGGDNRASVFENIPVYPLDHSITYLDLWLTITFDYLYPEAEYGNAIYLVTRNEDTQETKYRGIIDDRSGSHRKMVNLFNLLPEIKENGNFALFVEFRYNTQPNNFSYFLNYKHRIDDTFTTINGLPSAGTVGAITGASKINFTKNKRIVTSNSTVDITAIVDVAPTKTVEWQYAIIECIPGECFTISGQGGTDPRLYCFINDDNSQTEAVSLLVADVQERAYNKLIVAPKNATKLIINMRIDLNNNEEDPYCYKGVINFSDKILKIEKEKTLYYEDMLIQTALIPSKRLDNTSEDFYNYGRNFIINKNYVEISTTNTDASSYRGCQLLGPSTMFYTSGENEPTWKYWYSLADAAGHLTFYPFNFNTDIYDLCIQLSFDHVNYGGYNRVYVATKNMDTGEIKRTAIIYDNSHKDRINLFELAPTIKLNKNFQLIIESRRNNMPNSFYYTLTLQDKQNKDELKNTEIRPADYYFYDSYLTKRINDILNKFYNDNDSSGMSHNFLKNDIFIWITDPHYYETVKAGQLNGLQSTKLIKYLIQNINIPRVFCGGDLTRGTMNRDTYKSLIRQVRSHLDLIFDKTYFLIANHDWNDASGVRPDDRMKSWELYPLLLKDKENQYGSISSKMDYYVDNTLQKIRYFCIGCQPNANLFSDTILWLAGQLKLVPDDYTIVIFSHVGIGINETTKEYIYDRNFDEVGKMLDAARNQSTYTYSSQSFNYSDFQAIIACVLTGHCHSDRSITTATGIPIISTTCDMAGNGFDNAILAPAIRKMGTIGEQAFDVVQLDLENRKIYLTRIGGSRLNAKYDAENDAIVDIADYNASTDTINSEATRYDATSWVLYSPYKDRVFSY